MTDQVQPFTDRRAQSVPCQDHERRLSLTEQAVEDLRQTNQGITTKLDLILAQVTKVAILEERHNNQALDITRAHDKVGKLENKHDDLAIEIRAFMNQTKGMMKIVWAIGGVVGVLLVKVLFFAAHNRMAP